MILESLVKYYNTLAADENIDISRPGWSKQKISYAVDLDSNGNLLGLTNIMQTTEVKPGKESKPFPAVIDLPFAGKRGSNIVPNFLWENPGYIFGFNETDPKKQKKKSNEGKFFAYRQLAHNLLDPVRDYPKADAILTFLDGWDPLTANDNEMLNSIEDLSQRNLVLRVDGEFCYADKKLASLWDKYYEENGSENEDEAGDKGKASYGVSLISGEKCRIEMTHPNIIGFPGARPTGTALVSYNIRSVGGTGKEQGENGPISSYEAFAYTTAIKYMLNERLNITTEGNTLTVFVWAEDASPDFQKTVKKLMEKIIYRAEAEDGIGEKISRIAAGEKVDFDGYEFDPNQKFCVLGIEPNTARLAVSFFLKNSFGNLVKNIDQYYMDTKLTHTPKVESADFSIFQMMSGMKRGSGSEGKKSSNDNDEQKKKSKAMPPHIPAALIKSVFSGVAYPYAAISAVYDRIQASQDIKPCQAAFIKAYYTRKKSPTYPKEVLGMNLNLESTDKPYLLGRLFFLFERLQCDAIDGINATIRDRYFGSASTNPVVAFPKLVSLSEYHRKKMMRSDTKRGKAIVYDRQITDIMDKLGAGFPVHLSPEEQGRFFLGYYQQKAYFFTPKKDRADADDGMEEILDEA